MAITIRTEIEHVCGEVVVCSAYLPYDPVNLLPARKLVDLIQYCRGNSLLLVLGCDSNSDHVVWGRTETNTRGENLLEYLGGTDLLVHNRGNEPTFQNRLRKEAIDITVCSTTLFHRVKEWRVTDEPTLSD